MARIGINPARGMLSNYRPARITVTLISYIPDLNGYFSDRLKILALSFASLIQNTSLPYDLAVFDNGSCQPVVEFLRDLQKEGYIDYLIFSKKNIGKIGALQILFNSVPGEIIAYSDDDILFYPGWLQEQLEILETFPKAGMVSGVPVRNAALHAHQSLDNLIEHPIPGLSIKFERRIPDEWEVDWANSTGRDSQSYLAETREVLDPILSFQIPNGASGLIEEKKHEAIGSANHFQFIAPKQVLLQALPAKWTGKLMGHMIELDQAIDDLGYLRLATTSRTTRHLGNTLNPEILAEAESIGMQFDRIDGLANAHLPLKGKIDKQSKYRSHWTTRIPGSRRMMVWIYKKIFDILYN